MINSILRGSYFVKPDSKNDCRLLLTWLFQEPTDMVRPARIGLLKGICNMQHLHPNVLEKDLGLKHGSLKHKWMTT